MYTPLLAAFCLPTSTKKCKCRLETGVLLPSVLKIWTLCLSDSHVFFSVICLSLLSAGITGMNHHHTDCESLLRLYFDNFRMY